MRSNATREIAELVPAAVADGLVEAAARDSLRRPFQAPDPAGEDPGAAVAEQERDQQRRGGRMQHAPLHEVDTAELVSSESLSIST